MIEKDILESDKELKRMPFDVPEGYFEMLKKNLKHQQAHPEPEVVKPWKRFIPYLSLAAMFLLIAAGGGFFLQHTTESTDFTEEDFIIFSDAMTLPADEDLQLSESTQMEDEEIIEYLIYSGVSTYIVELSK